MYDLRFCPFCGRQPEIVEVYEYTDFHEGGWTWMVRCNYLKGGCGAKGPGRETKEEAIEVWNKRYLQN